MISLRKQKQMQMNIQDQAVPGYLVCEFPDVELGRICGTTPDGAFIVEYPTVAPSGEVYVVRDFWYTRQIRQAMQSDATLYNEVLWIESGLISA